LVSFLRANEGETKGGTHENADHLSRRFDGVSSRRLLEGRELFDFGALNA